MSRIGKVPVPIPPKVKVSLQNNLVKVEGPLGKLEKSFDRNVTIALEDGKVVLHPANDSRLAKAMHGTARAIIQNMVTGVVKGYVKELDIVGVGFKAAVQGKFVDLALGYSHPIKHPIPDGVKVTVTENTHLKVEGVDKHLVGEVAASIRAYYPVEPYKGKGVRITGQHIRRKEGKKTA